MRPPKIRRTTGLAIAVFLASACLGFGDTGADHRSAKSAKSNATELKPLEYHEGVILGLDSEGRTVWRKDDVSEEGFWYDDDGSPG